MNALADSASGTLDGAALFQTVSTWLALLAICFWIGGVLWEAVILSPADFTEGDLRATAEAAARRFRTLAPYALGLALLADLGAIRFGSFWWLRQLLVVAALALTILDARANGGERQGADVAARRANPKARVLTWSGELLAAVRRIGEVPDRVALGWQRLDPRGRVELLLAGALIVAFALSGVTAGAPASQTGYAFILELLHVLAEVLWFGGILYLVVVLLPVSLRLAAPRRARLLADGLPEFGGVALIAGALFIVTGALDAKLRLGSSQQLLTTPYGRTLIIEVELFLIMVAVSVYLVGFLRPQLALELGDMPEAAPGTALAKDAVELGTPAGRTSAGTAVRTNGGSHSLARGQPPSAKRGAGGDDKEPPLTPCATSLEERIRDWLRRQALLGGAVLLCVALLGIFAGSLMPAASAPSGSTSASATPFMGEQSAGGLTMRLSVSPDKFGTNTFTVVVKDAQGKPVTEANVALAIGSTDMDMGVATPTLAPVADAPGTYSTQATISMAGHWQAVVHVTPTGAQSSIQATFTFTAGY